MQKNPDLGFFLINMRSNSSIQTRITQEHHQAEGNKYNVYPLFSSLEYLRL